MTHALLRPRALLSHVLVLLVVATCVVAGQWQLHRLSQVREHNALLGSRAVEDPIDVGALAGGAVDPDELEFRRVTATGTFRVDEEVLQRNRGYRGQTGFDVLTPLELADGTPVLVRRGWVPRELDTPPVDEAAPPPGEVTVEGVLTRSVDQPTGWLGARDPGEGVLTHVFHADTDRLDRQVDGELFPLVLHLEDADATTADGLPFPQPRPERDEANHLSYAIQWHSFAVIALVTYAVWWLRRSRTGGDTEPARPQPAASPRPREPAQPPL
jgi:surfeit locus 1 family protein